MTSRSGSTLESHEFLAFDLETTGLSPEADEVVEIGAIRFRRDGAEIARFQRLVNPNRPIPWGAMRIHGISDEMVRGAPAIAEVLPEFLQFLGSDRRTILMAHNASFDRGFLERAITLAGLKQPAHDVLDTIRLARSRAIGLPSYSLPALVRHFRIAVDNEHRGLADAIALQHLFARLVTQAPAIATREELLACCRPAQRFAARGGGRSRRSSRPRSRSSNGATAPAALADPRQRDIGRRLQAALDQGVPVQIIYEGGRSAGTPRTVQPLRLFDSGDRSYLLAVCERDEIEKHFRLDRVREVSHVGQR